MHHASRSSAALRVAQSRAGASGHACPGLALVEHTRAHSLAPVRERFPDFADFLVCEPEAELFDRLCAAESIGRPLGDERFLARLERKTGRILKPGKRGPKPSVAKHD